MKKLLKLSLLLILFLVILTGAFLIYASDYYRADEIAVSALQSESGMRVQKDRITLVPKDSSDTALIFYPGAKVEYFSYIPILQKITQRSGVTCILVKMPLNMAIFDADAADQIMEQFPDIQNWYIGGHSMGGAMASDYASKNPEKIKGLVLLGAYVYGEYPPENALTIYGTFNTSVAEKIDYTENIVVIEGGNHAQFGNYGKQKGDPDATISDEEQQNIAVEAIQSFLAERN